MNPSWPAVDNMWDLVGNLWIGVVVIMAATVPSWMAAKKTHKSLSDIKDQVVNGHENPMRFDLDRVMQSIDELRRDIRSLRSDLMSEEDHRRIQISDLREELEHRTGKHRHTP